MQGKLDIFVVHGQSSQQDVSFDANPVKHLFGEMFPGVDVVLNLSSVHNLAAEHIQIHLEGVKINWLDFFVLVRRLKGVLEEHGLPVTQLIIGPQENHNPEIASRYPSIRCLASKNGAWIRPDRFNGNDADDLWDYLVFQRAIEKDGGWFVIPFGRDIPSDDSSQEEPLDSSFDYELCAPNEIPQHFATKINGSAKSDGAPVGLRVRMAPGSAITDYISYTYNEAIGSGEILGGSNIILTTLLQMNDKITLVNTYCEPLEDSITLNLLSLSAMNLRITDERADTDMATLAGNGNIVVSNIVLGDQ